MAVCDFTYKLTVPPAELLQEITKLVQDFKGEFQGDEQSGTFQFDIMMGTLVGKYQVTGDEVHIEILDKPFLIGSGIINQTIKEYLRGLS
jgi:hypothetical protein